MTPNDTEDALDALARLEALARDAAVSDVARACVRVDADEVRAALRELAEAARGAK